MKLIYDPRTNPWTNEITCYGCKAVFEIEESDVRYTTKTSNYADTEEWDVPAVKCPICGTILNAWMPLEVKLRLGL